MTSDKVLKDDRKGVAKRGTYHHGDLRLALIEAAEQLLSEQGIEAFSLRAAARQAGVSPAAPAHHFSDSAGLLTEIAIRGFDELTDDLIKWVEQGDQEPVAKLRSLGQAYIYFALNNRARFLLMFRKDKLRITEQLKAAAMHAFLHLQSTVCQAANVREENINEDTMASILAGWSMVHGFAHLALAGQFQRFTENDDIGKFCDTYVPLILAQLAHNSPKS